MAKFHIFRSIIFPPGPGLLVLATVFPPEHFRKINGNETDHFYILLAKPLFLIHSSRLCSLLRGKIIQKSGENIQSNYSIIGHSHFDPIGRQQFPFGWTQQETSGMAWLGKGRAISMDEVKGNVSRQSQKRKPEPTKIEVSKKVKSHLSHTHRQLFDICFAAHTQCPCLGFVFIQEERGIKRTRYQPQKGDQF